MIRPTRPQAEPLLEDEGWQIVRADIWAFAALVSMGGLAFAVWRLFS